MVVGVLFPKMVTLTILEDPQILSEDPGDPSWGVSRVSGTIPETQIQPTCGLDLEDFLTMTSKSWGQKILLGSLRAWSADLSRQNSHFVANSPVGDFGKT